MGLSAFRCGQVARGSDRRKASRIGEAHAFHEAPAEPVLAAFEPQRGNRTRDPRSRARRRRQRCQRQAFRRARRKKTPSRKRTDGCQSGSRAVKRDSPQPRSHRAAPSFPVPSPRVFGRAERGAKEDFSRERARAERLGTRASPARAPKGLTRISPLRWETTEHGCSSWNVSECRSRSDASPVATPVGATKRTSDTRDLARTKRRRRSDAHQRRLKIERQRCASQGASLLTTETSLGSGDARKPRRDRIRRGAGSRTREVLGPRARDR